MYTVGSQLGDAAQTTGCLDVYDCVGRVLSVDLAACMEFPKRDVSTSITLLRQFQNLQSADITIHTISVD